MAPFSLFSLRIFNFNFVFKQSFPDLDSTYSAPVQAPPTEVSLIDDENEETRDGSGHMEESALTGKTGKFWFWIGSVFSSHCFYFENAPQPCL